MNREMVLDKLKHYKETSGTKFQIKEIGIFGSVVRGENTSESDLDVIISLEKPDMYVMVHIKEDLEKEIGCAVDLVRHRTHMNKFLKEQIEKEAVFV
ncbi:MAG: nucleotidyltransferase domain-containing protein [Spirochaetia bacterium]|nr:nucleotidyltransferase domain-containing protein [Spirochaetia bacterium]